MISRKMLIPMAAVAVIGAAAYGAGRVSAAGNSTGPTLAQRISSVFGLDQNKVQNVINQYHTDQRTQADSKYDQRLSQAVTDGKITAGQKAAILTERNKLKSELDAAMTKTGTDRRTAMEQIHTEAQDWSKQNNLAAHWLLGPRPMRGMGPMGKGMGMMHPGNDNDADNSGSPATKPSPSSSPSA
jgi:hypothetical protein